MKRRVLVALGGLLLAALGAGPGGGAMAAEKVTLVTNPAIGYAHFWEMVDRAKKQGIEITLRRLPTFGQMQQALELGEAEIGMLGYQNLALMAEAGGPVKAKAIAGIYLAGQDIVFHKDVKITGWKDVEGKTIARIPGSFAELLFRVAAAYHGVDLNKVTFKDFQFSPATLTLSLERHEMDGLLVWVPTLVFPIVKGYGYRPPISINDTPVGGINGLFVASTKFTQEKPDLVLTLTKIYLESQEAYAKDSEAWIKRGREITGAEEPVLRESIKHLTLEPKMFLERARQFSKLGSSLKILKKDTSDILDQYFDYSFLMKATGKTQKELGG